MHIKMHQTLSYDPVCIAARRANFLSMYRYAQILHNITWQIVDKSTKNKKITVSAVDKRYPHK